jgi:hypothetical protein
MAPIARLLLVIGATLSLGPIGCGQSPPPATGEAYEPPRELDQMKNQMMESYKKGTVNKAQ